MIYLELIPFHHMLLYFQNFINEFKAVFSAPQLEVYLTGFVTLSEFIISGNPTWNGISSHYST